MNRMIEAASTIILAVIGLAIVSVLVSRKANTASVIQASASGLGNLVGVAQSPVSGANVPLNLGYPDAGGFGGFNF